VEIPVLEYNLPYAGASPAPFKPSSRSPRGTTYIHIHVNTGVPKTVNTGVPKTSRDNLYTYIYISHTHTHTHTHTTYTHTHTHTHTHTYTHIHTCIYIRIYVYAHDIYMAPCNSCGMFCVSMISRF